MTTGPKSSPLEASIRQRLLNRSRENGEEFQYLLTRFGIEPLTPDYADMQEIAWQTFLRKSRLAGVPELSVIIEELDAFLGPALKAGAAGEPFDLTWKPSAGWIKTES